MIGDQFISIKISDNDRDIVTVDPNSNDHVPLFEADDFPITIEPITKDR